MNKEKATDVGQLQLPGVLQTDSNYEVSHCQIPTEGEASPDVSAE